MGGNIELFEIFERNKYLKKLPSVQRVKSIEYVLSPRCPVSNSPVTFSEACTQQNTGPVITVSCGKVQTTLEGDHTITCEGGTCPDAYCDVSMNGVLPGTVHFI